MVLIPLKRFAYFLLMKNVCLFLHSRNSISSVQSVVPGLTMRNVDPCFGKEVQAQNKALADVSFIHFQNFVKHHNSLAQIKNPLSI